MKPLRILFMGTPDFAVPSLEALVQNGYNVVGVVTAPDKPAGRGQKVTYSPVKEFAVRNGLRILQPPNLKAQDFIAGLRELNADLQIVVAFRMLPEVVWSMPPEGTFNLHASLLPQYRGAAPINWAIINGESETGVTTFFLKHEIDTGSVIFQDREPIRDDDDAGSLYNRLMEKGARLVLRTVEAIADGTVAAQEQPHSSALRHAPKIFKETCEIRWDQSAINIRNFVRGLSPYPGAWTSLDGRTFKIFRVALAPFESDEQRAAPPGTWFTDNSGYLHFRATDGLVAVAELQPEGKKRMKIEDFFRGNKL